MPEVRLATAATEKNPGPRGCGPGCDATGAGQFFTARKRANKAPEADW